MRWQWWAYPEGWPDSATQVHRPVGGYYDPARTALRAIGGFDVALGAGTAARAGEDTAAIADPMLGGGTFVYWPAAIMWHEHRGEFAELERQLSGYGSGITAFCTRALLRHPRRLASLLRLVSRALRDLRGHGSVRTATCAAAGSRRASRWRPIRPAARSGSRIRGRP